MIYLWILWKIPAVIGELILSEDEIRDVLQLVRIELLDCRG